MVIGNLVHRDFEDIVFRFGDVVNTRRPGEFKALRKTNADQVTVQDATATNVQVPLNQHVHVSFMIKDGEESMSFKSLVDEYMAPAMLAQARFVDQLLLTQSYQFLSNSYGHLGQIASNNVIDYATGTRNILNQHKAYVDGRNLVLAPRSETAFLNNQQFTAANLVGDDGTALREASLGRKFGFDIFMCQNTPSIIAGNTVKVGAVNNSGGYSAGANVLTTNTFTGAVTTNSWCTIAGDDRPQQITAHMETGGNTTQITISPGLGLAVANSAAITAYTPGTVAASYVADYGNAISFSGFSVAPQVGQMATFNTDTTVYGIIEVDLINNTITLDRPLKNAITSGDSVNIGPAGDFNFAFHRNALALVVRPLAMPRDGLGARSAVVNMNGFSMRATLTYNGLMQGTLVTLDMLLGVAVLDLNLGSVMLG